MTAHETKSWMRYTLWVAGAYHIALGLFAVAFPLEALRLLAAAPQTSPGICQVFGGVLAAIGAGLLCAGADPVRHWPVVFTGLLSMILGPVLYLQSIVAGREPWAGTWTVLTLDAVWWIPFGLVLHHAYQETLAARRIRSGEVLKLALRARSQYGKTLAELSQESPLLLVFLRHMGCPFCREALADLAGQREAIERMGTRIAIVHMSDPENAQRLLCRNQLDDVHRFDDPRQSLYRAFGLARGRLLELLGPKVWIRGTVATLLERHWPGKVDGDAFQLPGLFVLFHGEVIRSYRHQSAADRPSYISLAGAGLPGFGRQ
jgi:peroxiredoxin